MKNRLALVYNEIETFLFGYTGEICKGLECKHLKAGSYIDHVHVLTLLSRKISQMNLLEEIKKQSSKCPPAGRAGVRTKDLAYSNFYWQNAYGIFSVNPSEIDIVVNYLSNQATHSTKLSFQDEFREFLKKYNLITMNDMSGINILLTPLQGLNSSLYIAYGVAI